ncbi:hypothetical protein [Dactylosporangium matsuzakiense]|uniref:hypothetical protein n=1 Tax=Dactylosporangium matsuzakiense TaxID=53360 RepID=UPI0022F2A7A0|nr:hypothetical protein [Dactylosporangium matsuzakiense]
MSWYLRNRSPPALSGVVTAAFVGAAAGVVAVGAAAPAARLVAAAALGGPAGPVLFAGSTVGCTGAGDAVARGSGEGAGGTVPGQCTSRTSRMNAAEASSRPRIVVTSTAFTRGVQRARVRADPPVRTGWSPASTW